MKKNTMSSKLSVGNRVFCESFAVKTGEASTSRTVDLDSEFGGWKMILRSLKSSGDVFPDVDLDDIKDADYDIEKAKSEEMWNKINHFREKAKSARESGYGRKATAYEKSASKWKKRARTQEMRASYILFELKNRKWKNEITFDLHDQRVREALMILKIHLWIGYEVRSIKRLNVITGRGKHTGGFSNLKEEVIKFLNRKNITWRGTSSGGKIVIYLRPTKKDFVLSSDSE